MSLHRMLVVFVAVLFLAGCGSSGGSGSGDADPAQVIPTTSLFYVEGVVRPEGEQKDNVEALLDRFLKDRSLEDLLDEAIQEDMEGQTYAKDIKPWLGERVGVGVASLTADEPVFIAGIAVSDKKKAQAYVKRTAKGEAKTYKDSTYYLDGETYAGVAGDFVVLTDDEAQFKKAVDTTDGESLGDSERFKTAVEELPDERLGTFYLDLKGFGKLIRADPEVGAAGGAIFDKLFANGDPVTAALTAEPDAATVESRISQSFAQGLGAVGLLGAGASTPLVREVPEDSIAVFGSPKVGTALKNGLETFAGALGGAALTGSLEQEIGINLDRDLFSWVGDVSVFVRGDSVPQLNGAVVIGVTDEAAATAALPRLVAAAKRNGAPVQDASIAGADQAFSAPVPGAPAPVVIAQAGDRVVVALGEQAAADALQPAGTIAESGLYDRAKSAIDGIEPTMILDAPSILKLIEQTAAGDPRYAEAKPYLDQLDLIASGAEEDGDALRSLFTVKAK